MTEPDGKHLPSPDSSPVDTMAMEMYLQRLRENQDLSRGITGGLAAALGAAILWALITYLTHIQIGFMSIGVGFLVGYAVRTLGQGVDPVFGYSGAALSLFGCLLGNLLAVAVAIASQEDLPILEVLGYFLGNPSAALEAMKLTFHPMDILFYGIAVYWGYKYSIRVVTMEEISGGQIPQS